MNIVYIHHNGASLALVAAAVAAQGSTLCLHVPPVTVEAITAHDPAVLLVEARTAATHELCRRLKQDARTAATPLLVIAPPASETSRRWSAFADDMLELPLSADEFTRRLRAWCALQERWHRRLDTQITSTLLVLRRVAALARRARGVVGERLIRDAGSFGRFLELSDDEQATLEDGARLHDFGDLSLPSVGPDLESLARYRPELSESLLAPIASPALLAIIRHHSERWDGRGFPDQLEGSSIPRLARIMRLLVRFDHALHAGHSRAEALEMLERETREGGCDPELFAAFARWRVAGDLGGEDPQKVEP